MTGGVKPFNGIPNLLLISGSSTTIIHKTLQKKIKIEQHEPTKNRG
jgi:hypothetical protein